MALLAALALAGWVGAASLARHWQEGAGAALTVQVPQPGEPAAQGGGTRLERVLALLARQSRDRLGARAHGGRTGRAAASLAGRRGRTPGRAAAGGHRRAADAERHRPRPAGGAAGCRRAGHADRKPRHVDPPPRPAVAQPAGLRRHGPAAGGGGRRGGDRGRHPSRAGGTARGDRDRARPGRHRRLHRRPLRRPRHLARRDRRRGRGACWRCRCC